MNSPFQKPEDRARIQKVLDSIITTRETIDDAREWLTKCLDEAEDEEGCSCVHDEVFELDTLLFSVYRIMHLVGSGIVSHLNSVDVHEAAQHARKQGAIPVVGVAVAVPHQLTDDETTATPMPVDVDDKGPGPNGAH